MSESRNHFVFELLVLLCCISFQDVSGIQIKLTRDEKGDYFTNPYSTTPSASKFCDLTNARCFNDDRRGHNAQCSHCKCNVTTFKTFNEINLRCAPIQDFGQGCRTWLSDNSVKLLNLTGNGMEKLQTDSDKDVKSLHIMSMKFNFFKVKGIRKKQDDSRRNRWEVTIEWENVPNNIYDGQVFRAQISYEIVGDDSNRNDCFVFKSKGTITVTFPDITTTLPLPSTSEKLTIQTSPSHTEPSTITITASPTDSVSNTVFTNVISTSTVSSSDQFSSSSGTRKKERNGGGSNAVAVSLAVVGCLLLLGVILAVVLWYRRRSKRSQNKKNTVESSMANGNAENPMVMSQVESSQTETRNSKNSSEVGEVDHEYYNAEGDIQNYASLDVTKVESKPVYESLINVEKDVYENIPSESGGTSTSDKVNREYENAEGDVENYASLDMTKVESKPVYQPLINVERDLYENISSEEKTGKGNP